MFEPRGSNLELLSFFYVIVLCSMFMCLMI